MTPDRRRRRRGARLAAALAVGAALAVSCGGDGTGTGDRPNILFIVADDMTVADLAHMPELQEWVGDEGTTFDRAYVSASSCCPARVTMLRGQYAHNTGVLANEGDDGGFPAVQETGVEQSNVATWLEAGAYRTALLGKYVNFYPLGAGVTYVPPGWDEWVSPVVGAPASGRPYTLNEDGTLVPYGDAPEDYLSRVLVDRAVDVAARSEDADEPFFVWLAVDEPHHPAVAAPEDRGSAAGQTAPRPPSFDQEDVSSQPAWIADLDRFTPAELEEIDERHRARVEALRSLDRELARLGRELDELGQLDDTYVVFVSDNGFHLGQHRLKAGKQSAYEEDVAVPLLVRGPGVPAGETSDALVVDTDFAPTFAELAGVDVPQDVDGRSLVDLWQDPDRPFERRAVLLEHWLPVFGTAPPSVDDTGPQDVQGGEDPVVAVARPNPEAFGEGASPPDFRGLRTGRYTYVEYVTGEIELYDNAEDPDQLHNLADRAPAELLADLAARLGELRECAGASCRAAEDRDVP